MSAPSTAVGIFAGDACALFAGSTTDPACLLPATQLVSMNSLASNCASAAVPCAPVATTNNAVRFIINSGTAQTVFGTPFGNAPRNIAQDAISNIANVSVFKTVKFNERVAFEFHTTAQNVFNHPNFLSVDPFLEDAGFQTQFTGFGDPSVTDSQPRKLIFGGKITF